MVVRLASLFALDAFAGGLLVQSLIAYWFHIRFGVDVGTLGSIFFGANILAGISALLAVRLARIFGLINTMVFTHIPSSLCLIAAAFAPNLVLALTFLLNLAAVLVRSRMRRRSDFLISPIAPLIPPRFAHRRGPGQASGGQLTAAARSASCGSSSSTIIWARWRMDCGASGSARISFIRRSASIRFPVR